VRRAWLGAVALVLLGAWALRLWQLDTQSLWHDEAWSVFSAYHPLAPMGIRGSDPNAPPLFYMTLGLWQNLAGDAVWTMRYWSLLWGVITAALAVYIGRRWCGRQAGLLAGILVAVSPILWVFSQEIRAYVVMPLLALLLLLLVDSLLKPGQVPRRIWLWLPAVELIALYTHNLSAPLIAWLNVTVLLAWPFTRRSIRQYLTWFAIQIGLLALYLPWLITQRQTGTPLNTPPALTPALFWDIWQSYFTGIKALVGADSTLLALSAVFGGLTLVAAGAALIGRPSRRTWLLLSQVILLPVFQLAIILAAHIDFHPRYFILGVPATLILVAVGVESLFVPIKEIIIKYPLQPVAVGGVAMLGGTIMGCMVNVMYSSPVYQHDDFRAIAVRYAKLGPNDAVIIPYGWEPTLDYYSRKMGFQAKFIEIPIHSSADMIIDQLRGGLQGVKGAEVLTWYQLPADVRGAYPCLLGAAGRATNDTLIVSGLRTDAYMIPQNALQPVQVATTAQTFGNLTLKGVSLVNPTEGGDSCVMLRWELTGPTTENWRISVRVPNLRGWDMLQADTDLLNDNQLPTSLWSVGESAVSFSWFSWPDAAPEAEYPVYVRVYNEKTPQLKPDVQIGEIQPHHEAATAYPTEADKLVADGLYLHQAKLPAAGALLQPGREMRVTLEFWLTGRTGRNISVVLAGQGWHVSAQDLVYQAHSAEYLSWLSLRVPAAAIGHAVLKLVVENGQIITLAEYDIAPVARQFTEPSIPLNARLVPPAAFSGVGHLIGAVTPGSAVSAANPLPVTLLWKASATADAPYTVFVHLRGADGQIIAQADGEPLDGKRPTTTWLTGEYLVDQHALTFNDLGKSYTGPATLVVGLYDASSGKRVLLSDGGEFSPLPVTVEVR
jgi:hypothetical protein